MLRTTSASTSGSGAPPAISSWMRMCDATTVAQRSLSSAWVKDTEAVIGRTSVRPNPQLWGSRTYGWPHSRPAGVREALLQAEGRDGVAQLAGRAGQLQRGGRDLLRGGRGLLGRGGDLLRRGRGVLGDAGDLGDLV